MKLKKNNIVSKFLTMNNTLFYPFIIRILKWDLSIYYLNFKIMLKHTTLIELPAGIYQHLIYFIDKENMFRFKGDFNILT